MLTRVQKMRRQELAHLITRQCLRYQRRREGRREGRRYFVVVGNSERVSKFVNNIRVVLPQCVVRQQRGFQKVPEFADFLLELQGSQQWRVQSALSKCVL